jgi:hypothetical protein
MQVANTEKILAGTWQTLENTRKINHIFNDDITFQDVIYLSIFPINFSLKFALP